MRRILVIDDEADIRELTSLSIRRTTAWQVETAGSGEDGIRSATSRPPDAILLDVHMPSMDGPSTLRHMQTHPLLANIPIIFFTGNTRPADTEPLSGLGVTAILPKPFDPLTLAGDIASVLGWSQPQ
jgi:CheY-like chemotaxis protein